MKHILKTTKYAAAALSFLLPTALFAQDSFYLGTDMGWLTEYESQGWKCYDKEGNERECMSLMADYGINAQRIRVWVDPSAHGNWCNKEDVLVKCKRAQSLGQDIMINFHYSDWWADPAKQNIPAKWIGHNFKQMKKDLAEHTTEVLQYLKDNGITPKWVQVGNETSHGMLWSVKMDPNTGWEYKDENGRTVITESMGHLDRNPQQYAGFFKAGYEAAKKVFPDIKVIVHLDNGFDNALYNKNLDTLIKYGAKFDIIGMSIYPYWSIEAKREPDAETTISDCIKNINLVSKKYDVDVIITETGFEVDEKHPEVMLEGRNQLRRLIRECKTQTNGRCKGVFYWEPECRPRQYKLGAFTSDGRPTAIMDGFRETNPQDTLTVNHPEYLPSMKKGDIAPDFTANDTTGNSFSLSSYRGKYVVLDFWATWCGDCRKEIPHLKQLHKEYKNLCIDGIPVEWLSMSFDTNETAWKNVLKKEQFDWNQISILKSTREDPTFKLYSLHWIPAFFVIEPDGRIAGTAITTNGLRNIIENLK